MTVEERVDRLEVRQDTTEELTMLIVQAVEGQDERIADLRKGLRFANWVAMRTRRDYQQTDNDFRHIWMQLAQDHGMFQ